MGGWGYCSPTCKCSAGEGDCDTNDDCEQGLICKQDVGAKYGWNKYVDVCEYPSTSTTTTSTSTTTTYQHAAETLDPVSIGSTSATLGGKVIRLWGYSSGKAYIGLRKKGEYGWVDYFADGAYGVGDTFTVTIKGLKPVTTYEYRASIEAPYSHPVILDNGDMKEFTTKSS